MSQSQDLVVPVRPTQGGLMRTKLLARLCYILAISFKSSGVHAISLEWNKKLVLIMECVF